MVMYEKNNRLCIIFDSNIIPEDTSDADVEIYKDVPVGGTDPVVYLRLGEKTIAGTDD